MLISDVLNKDELSALIIAELKEFGVKFRKEKKNKCTQEKCCKKIFRMPLAALELTDVVLASGGIVQIPKFVADACQRILEQVETEGLFRKAGSTNRQKEIKVGLEAGLPLGRTHHVIDVANVLKSFFRELPESLIPSSIQEPLLRCLLTGEKGVKPLLMTCLLLPTLSVNTLAFFMQFLHTVSLCSHRNKMTIENLAILFTPGLMPLADISGIRFANHVKVVKLLIEQSELIGILPESIAEKLIHSTAKTPSEGDKKKKKRRSGSLTRMFNGLRKIVGVIGSAESLDSTPENEPATPCISKSAKKRKMADVTAFSAKKKKELLALFPDNGGILPNTPYSEKESKKTRLSLGGRKNSKNTSASSGNGTVERRWSMVGPSWSRKKQSQTDLTRKENSNPSLSPVVSMPCITSTHHQSEVSAEEVTAQESDIASTIEPAISSDYDYVRIPKCEYEAIKERVSAIETRISQEFGTVRECILQSSSSDLENSLSGPEKVLNKFEKTMEEAGNVSSPRTDLLAKRLSRELKIRRSEEHKVIRSPSARKIGTMRRRSRESVKLARNKTWHISNRKLSDVQPNVEVVGGAMPFYPKSNLKRGRPNTVFTGLHQPSSVGRLEIDESAKENCLQFEDKWTSAEIFFQNSDVAIRRSIDAENGKLPQLEDVEMEQETLTPAKKPKSNCETPVNQTPHYVTTINIDEVKTPMLPPKSAVKKASVCKSQAKAVSKNVPPPPEEGPQGRASIARLRSQNAGMVLAKAKLFNELGSESDKGKYPPRHTENRRKSSVFMNKVNTHAETNNCYVVPYKTLLTQMPKDKMSDLSVKTPRRKASGKSPGHVQKRQTQKLTLARQAIQNRTTMENIVTEIENVSNPNESSNIRNGSTIRRSNSGKRSSQNENLYQNTPRIKKSLHANSPRRFVKTPRGHSTLSSGRRTPLKATPLRCSPRLKLQAENKHMS